jgi:hypothetical protein
LSPQVQHPSGAAPHPVRVLDHGSAVRMAERAYFQQLAIQKENVSVIKGKFNHAKSQRV